MIESNKYIFRNLDSVPLYDEEKDYYLLFVEGQEVKINSKLFKKLFKPESEEREIDFDIILDKGTDGWFNKLGVMESYDMLKQAVTMIKKDGVSKEDAHKELEKLTKDYEGPIKQFFSPIVIQIVEEIYEKSA